MVSRCHSLVFQSGWLTGFQIIRLFPVWLLLSVIQLLQILLWGLVEIFEAVLATKAHFSAFVFVDVGFAHFPQLFT